jgi:hypothetical protein
MKTIMMQFLDELKKGGYNIPLEHYNSMLEIEKEQIIDAMEKTAMYVSAASLDKEIGKMNFEDFYNQTYNQNK